MLRRIAWRGSVVPECGGYAYNIIYQWLEVQETGGQTTLMPR